MKQLSSKSKKIIIAVTVCVVVLALVIAIPNICLTQIGKQTQTGTPAGYEWSAQDSYDTQKITSLDMGDGEYKILVLTDIHRKNHGTFAKELGINYLLDGISEIAIKNLVKKNSPDLILVLGDTVLTSRNDIETEKFVKMMDSFKIPWACVFGNHDDEGRADKNKLAEILSDSEYGLFEYGPSDLHGAGNYVLSLEREGQTKYAIFMMDSGSSHEFEAKTDGINEKQVSWYEWNMQAFKEKSGEYPKNMAMFHIPLQIYTEFQSDYVMGERKEDSYPGNTDAGLLDSMLNLNGTHILAGHDHSNNFIVDYNGMKIGYATKSSYNCYFSMGMTGGTLITIDKDNNTTENIVEF